jgi:hypothetical protein
MNKKEIKMKLGFLEAILCILSCSNVMDDENIKQIITVESIEVVNSTESYIKEATFNRKTKKEIDELAAEIDSNLKNFQRIDTTVLGYSTEGTELVGYFQNNIIKKIIAKHAGEYGNLIESIYFDESEFVLIVWDETYYNKPIFEQGVTEPDSTAKEYFYFDKKELIEWFKNENRVPKEADNYMLHKKRFKKDIEEYLKILNSKLN